MTPYKAQLILDLISMMKYSTMLVINTLGHENICRTGSKVLGIGERMGNSTQPSQQNPRGTKYINQTLRERHQVGMMRPGGHQKCRDPEGMGRHGGPREFRGQDQA